MAATTTATTATVTSGKAYPHGYHQNGDVDDLTVAPAPAEQLGRRRRRGASRGRPTPSST